MTRDENEYCLPVGSENQDTFAKIDPDRAAEIARGLQLHPASPEFAEELLRRAGNLITPSEKRLILHRQYAGLEQEQFSIGYDALMAANESGAPREELQQIAIKNLVASDRSKRNANRLAPVKKPRE